MKFFAHSIFCTALLASIGVAAAAQASEPFGTEEEAHAAADRLIEVFDESGPEGAEAYIRDESTDLGSSPMGIVFHHIDDNQLIVLVHSQFPEISGLDFTSIQDLRGNYMRDDFIEAADSGGADVMNYWPRYDGETEHEYRCFAKWVDDNGEYLLTVCR